MNNQSTLLHKEKTIKENRIWVRIAAACNEKCLFCLDSDAQNGKLIDESVVKQQIQDGFRKNERNRVILSGGEASINPKFTDYIRYAKEIGYERIQTVTNGNMFSRFEFSKKVFDAGLDEVTFSLHGHTKELHDYLTDTPGSFDKAIKALLNIKKYFPHIIVSIDIVVNKVNVDFLPHIVKFFMRLGVSEFDILQIVPFGRGFGEYKDQLFYKIEDHLESLHATWKLSKEPGMYMWTNRFPSEAFEGYEDLIQDPRKIESETMGEAYDDFSRFISTQGAHKPECYGEACSVCFLHQYCHDFIKYPLPEIPHDTKHIIDGTKKIPEDSKFVILRGEYFPSDVYAKYGKNSEDFLHYIQSLPLSRDQELVNVPRCIRKDNNFGKYERAKDGSGESNIESYTDNYIKNLYRKKSTRCSSCKYASSCEGIHINFIRSYGFSLLKPIN